MNKAIEVDQQDMSAYSNLSNKHPVTILNEYAAKNHLVPHYTLIHDGSSLSIVSFKYSVNLDKFVAEGEATSKKKAKHLAASNLLKKMINDKPQLLNTDFDECTIPPYDIKVNYIGKLYDMCRHKNIKLPEYNLVREEGQDHNKLFTISCHVAKMIETATHKTKKQAKHLAAVQMVNKLMSIDKSLVMEGDHIVSDSMKVLEQVEIIKSEQIKKSMPMDVNFDNYHLLFKETIAEWSNSVTLQKIINQYNKNGTLDLPEAFKVLCNVVTECDLCLTSNILESENVERRSNVFYILTINNVYPAVHGLGEGMDTLYAQQMAAKELLIGICILLK